MEENKNQLFRKKSMESIESPNELNEYLRVTSPGVWILMAAILIFLAGVIIWGAFGSIEATAPVAVAKQDGRVVCYVPKDALPSIIEKPEVKIEGKKVALKPDSLEPVAVTQEMNVYVLLAGSLSAGDIVYPIEMKGTIREDVVQGTIVTEKIHPISFLLN